jgi:hypothetical protein
MRRVRQEEVGIIRVMRVCSGAVVLACLSAHAQGLLNPDRMSARLKDFDAPAQAALRCEVTPLRPSLNFSFRFQSGYVASFPAHEFTGTGHSIFVVTRITPEGGDPVYLGSRYRFPKVPADAKQQLEIGGGFLLGEGRYRVAWKMVDEQGRTCRKEWRLDAKLRSSERQVRVALPPERVADVALRGAPVSHDPDDAPPVRLTVLLHAAPVVPFRTSMGGRDRILLLGTLASLLERIPAKFVRVVVFNLDQQRELYRQDDFHLRNLDQVAGAVNQLQLGLVDYHVLQNRKGHVQLLADLINAELEAKEPSDLVVFLGPEARYSEKIPEELLAKGSDQGTRFYYLEYKPFLRMQASYPDTIHSAVSRMKGKSLVIHSPGEFAKAITMLEKP